MKPRVNLVRLFALGMTGLTWAGISDAAALDYPTRPVRWIVGYPAGGSTDILARLVGQYLSEKLGQQFIIENKPGAGNNIATEAVINAPPDGYTLLFVNPANGINASLYKKLSFNFVRDIAPVAGITRVPNVMEVNPNVPAKTVAEFIAYAKANPNKVNLASSGNGTSVHLSGELFMAMTGVKLTHVPYRGSAPALTDMIAGQVQVLFDNLPSSIQHVTGGQAARARGDHRASARLRCRMCRPSRKPCRATRRARGLAWARPRVLRPRSLRCSTRRSTKRLPTRTSRRGWPKWAGCPWAARRRILARSSPMRPRSGERWSSSPAPAWTKADTHNDQAPGSLR